MGEQVGGVHKVRALIWGFSSSSGKSRSLSSRRGTHLSSCSFQRFLPSCGGSHHVRTVFVALGTCLLHWEHVCHIRNTFVALGTCLLSCSFRRFVPSCGGSCRIRNVFIVSFVILLVPEVCALQWGFSLSSGRSKSSSLGNVFIASFVIPLVL